MHKVAVIIPTYNAKNDIQRLLDSLQIQEGVFDVLVVDSSSIDGTANVVAEHPVVTELVSILSSEFNHGNTRQMMVDRFPNYDFYVFLTQDAYMANEKALVEIMKPFENVAVGAVCGRQLPHLDADPFAAHARLFNYPNSSRLKSIEDVSELGIKVPFISNSFSAYKREALDSVGGFPNNVILGEDMYVAARMAMSGWLIAYAGSAQVYHSHNYTLRQEWRRYFDTGVFHIREPWLKEVFGGAGREGADLLSLNYSI